MVSNLRNETISGFMYKMLERIGVQGVNFVVSIILARILLPEEYGVISLVTIFIQICDVFVTYGFGNSLIANKDSDDLDFSTCFYFGIFFSLIVYIGIFIFAPFMADFYQNPLLIPVIRVMGLRVPIAAINSVQTSYVSKHMMFKNFFYATSIATVISGMIGIVMAYTGYGVWALVGQYIGNVLISTITLWFIVGWRPKQQFSITRLKDIYQYGWKILVVGLIDTGYSQIRSLVIAKKYTSTDLAYYNKGMQFPALAMNILEPTINSVLFPALSRCNNDVSQMRGMMQRLVKLSTYLVFPIMLGLAVVAESLVTLLLTEKWLFCVPFLQIGCLAYMFRPLQVINNSVIKASGRSDLLLKLDIVKKVIGIILLMISIPYGVIGIAISLMVNNIISTLINVAPNQKLLQYGYLKQIRDIGENLLLAFFMAIIVWVVGFFNWPVWIKLLIQIVIGVAIYIFLSIVFKVDSFIYLNKLLKEYYKKLKK